MRVANRILLKMTVLLSVARVNGPFAEAAVINVTTNDNYSKIQPTNPVTR
jgi:hypothetical protein